jgi:hypothetical protein
VGNLGSQGRCEVLRGRLLLGLTRVYGEEGVDGDDQRELEMRKMCLSLEIRMWALIVIVNGVAIRSLVLALGSSGRQHHTASRIEVIRV